MDAGPFELAFQTASNVDQFHYFCTLDSCKTRMHTHTRRPGCVQHPSGMLRLHRARSSCGRRIRPISCFGHFMWHLSHL